MEERVLHGRVEAGPRELPGRNIFLQASPDVVTRIPLDPEQVTQLVKELSLTDEEMQQEMARRRVASQIVIASGNGHG